MQDGQSEESLIEARDRSDEGIRTNRQNGKVHWCVKYIAAIFYKLVFGPYFITLWTFSTVLTSPLSSFQSVVLVSWLSNYQLSVLLFAYAERSSAGKCCQISPLNLVCISHAFSAWVRRYCLPPCQCSSELNLTNTRWCGWLILSRFWITLIIYRLAWRGIPARITHATLRNIVIGPRCMEHNIAKQRLSYWKLQAQLSSE